MQLNPQPNQPNKPNQPNSHADQPGPQPPQPGHLPQSDRSPAVGAPAQRARLLITCPDRPGTVAAVTRFLFTAGANIAHLDQHITAPTGGQFFMRVEFDLPDLEQRRSMLEQGMAGVAEHFGMAWRLEFTQPVKRMAIFVSREDHCLLELLWQWQAGDLPVQVAMVISNHDALRPAVAALGIPFHHVPVTAATKAAAEARQLELMAGQVELVVLARYMQILSGEFIRHYPQRIINIHHSFLPAFAGAKPYNQAYERGVKLIGATAHYVTAELDAGPIIEQGVHRVTHRDTVEDLKRVGRHVERVVLARAVKWHGEDRVLVSGNKTVVFS